MASETEKIVDFLIEANKLKDVKRTGWLMVGVKSPESVASHVFTLALMSSLLSKKLKVNKAKLIDMVLIHDLCEIYAGDIATRKDGSMYVLDKKGKLRKFKGNKKIVEEKAMKKILSKLPVGLKNRYYKLWREFENKKTKESKIAHELDKLDYSILSVLYKKRANKKIKKLMDIQDYVSGYVRELHKIVEKRFYR